MASASPGIPVTVSERDGGTDGGTQSAPAGVEPDAAVSSSAAATRPDLACTCTAAEASPGASASSGRAACARGGTVTPCALGGC